MISIIVPVYNSEKYINRCLDSILNQTYKDLEIVLVNDGSTDQSLSILENYAAIDSRIKVVSQQNQGVAVARNTGLDNATGNYILYVDSDDWIENNMVGGMVELSANADIVFCGHDTANTPDKVDELGVIEIEEWDQERQLLEFMKHKRMTGMLWNKLIKKDLTEGCRFNPKTGYGEDAEFLWKILKKSDKMVVTNEILYHHVMEDTSISHLSFNDKKYSAIPMWEEINKEVEESYTSLIPLARERLMCVAVFSMYEARKCGYRNKEQLAHMRFIVRRHLFDFMKSKNVSRKFKAYALAIGGDTDDKVSVIVPIYNTEKYLEKCLDSIINQSYRNIEIILVNDGSKDGSFDIAKRYRDSDERVWLFNQENSGVSSARNLGIELSSGSYVFMIDSDDYIEPDMIEVLLKNLRETDADISCCQYDKGYKANLKDIEVWDKDKTLEMFVAHKAINGSVVNKLIKREIIAGNRFDKKIKYGEDALFLWKCLLNIDRLVITNKILYHVTLHDDSASGGGSYKPIRRDCILVWKEITSDAEIVNAHLGDLSKAQLANMAFYSFYSMAYYNYHDSKEQKLFLDVVRDNYIFLKKGYFIPKSEQLMAKIMIISPLTSRVLIAIKRKLK